MEKSPLSSQKETLPGNLFHVIKIDTKGRMGIPPNIRKHFEIGDGYECILSVSGTSLHIVIDPKRQQEILALDVSQAPAYERKRVDSTGRILFGSKILDMVRKEKGNHDAYYRYHNGTISIFFDKDIVQQEQKKQFTNTEKLFGSQQQQSYTQGRVNQIYSVNWNTDPLKSYRKKGLEQK